MHTGLQFNQKFFISPIDFAACIYFMKSHVVFVDNHLHATVPDATFGGHVHLTAPNTTFGGIHYFRQSGATCGGASRPKRRRAEKHNNHSFALLDNYPLNNSNTIIYHHRHLPLRPLLWMFINLWDTARTTTTYQNTTIVYYHYVLPRYTISTFWTTYYYHYILLPTPTTIIPTTTTANYCYHQHNLPPILLHITTYYHHRD